MDGHDRDRLRALRRHRVPAWWLDAKLGIFVHWTPASVPGWAPTHTGIGELLASGRPDALAEIPYTEWYENSLRFPGSSVARHHRDTYGDRPYATFASDFEAGLSQWDPDEWARRFRAAGARYVVLVAKHHDGWCLWPTGVSNPNRPGWHSRRDLVGELADAVRGVGLRFGLYYSGGLDWTFDGRPIGGVADAVAAIPRGRYPAYAEAHVRELVARYRPSVLWNDIAWPSARRRLWRLLADYYRAVPDGVVNDRWMPWSPLLATTGSATVRKVLDAGATRAARRSTGMVPPAPPHFDVRTPEYTTFDDVQSRPWECVRGIDRSFGFNRASADTDFLGRHELLAMLADIVAKGGNLLLNVGPRGEDATIPQPQLRRLDWLAAWTSAGEGGSIFGSRPWVSPAARSEEGADLRYWARDDRVWAAVLGDASGRVTIAGVRATAATAVSCAGSSLAWTPTAKGIAVEMPESSFPVVELRGVEAASPPT